MTRCWCGSEAFSAFSPEYSRCNVCGTLVLQQGPLARQLRVNNDDVDFYGKRYWLDHQSEDFDYPDIHVRVRNDLTERNLHWLRTLLKYKLPPGRVMELGCSHGSFVAMLRQAGFAPTGVEMSPWVVDFGRKAFDVDIRVGPVEELDIESEQFDAIVLMDVLEHLFDPVATMSHCLDLLKPDGVLLIQTPQFKEEMDYKVLQECRGAFLEQLKIDEHLYLFSSESVVRLFERLGANHVCFEPAIFDRYDMFLAVSRAPLTMIDQAQADAGLLASVGGRFCLALLDLRERELDLLRRLAEAESDRAARGEQIQKLTDWLRVSEADREARGEQIERLTTWLKDAHAERTALSARLEELTVLVQAAESDWLATEEARGIVATLTAEKHRLEEQCGILQDCFRTLQGRPVFRLFDRVFAWPELKELSKRTES